MNQVIMILLISVLVLVHEMGHFMAARMCGVRVSRFGIGMPIGPSWKLFKWKQTTFYLHAFLFGGYVAFADDEKAFREEEEKAKSKKKKEDKKEEDIDLEDELLPSDSPELYENKTIPQKLFIVSAGVLMNVIFAIILVMCCALFYQKLPTQNQTIYVNGFGEKQTSNIQQFDVKKDDQFYKANGTKINSLYQMFFFIKNSKMFDDYAQEDLIQENLKELKKLNPNIKDNIQIGQTIILPKMKAEKPLSVNKNVLSGLEKYKKDGLKLSKEQIELRDELLNKKTYKFNSETSLNDVAYAVSDTYKPLTLTFLRDKKEHVIENIIIQKEGMLGIKLKYAEIYDETKTLKDVFTKSCKYIYTTTATMLFGLWQLISGKIPASDMHGIIAITKLGGDIIAAKGMLNGILLTAMISINLAIMNFLPIPALDGGHVMFLVIEKITGKKPTRELSEKINNFFFMLLIILMVVICYNDIFALVTKKF